jgi:DNA topoisomerase-1
VQRQGRYGLFTACSRYPECKYIAPREGRRGRPAGDRPEPKLLDEKCDLCGSQLVERQGRFGPFKSCSRFPKCKGPSKAVRDKKPEPVGTN